jgi:8-oxo-dGTP diphosphatase
VSDAKQVVAAILRSDGSVLVCQRRADQPFALQWEFPGGKVEAGESLAEALARELHEELGLRAVIGPEVATVLHQYREGLYVELHFLTVESYTGELQNRIFHSIEWREPGELDADVFLEADRDVVRRLGRGELQGAARVGTDRAAKDAAL